MVSTEMMTSLSLDDLAKSGLLLNILGGLMGGAVFLCMWCAGPPSSGACARPHHPLRSLGWIGCS